MPSFKKNRLSEDLKRELISLMRELKDPRFANAGMLTIVRTDLSGDGSYYKVFVSSLEGLEEAKEACKGLTSASGFLRREISNRLRLRKCPGIKFIPDDSIAYGAEIDRKLRNITREAILHSEEADMQARKEDENDHES